MKQKDIVVLIVVAFISAIASLVLSKQFFTTAQDKAQQAEKIDKISAEFDIPNNKYFNAQSVNPAQLLELGTANPDPFRPAD